MKVAVSGATGFVGHHVIAELERRGVPPTIVCRLERDVPAALAHLPVARVDLHSACDDVFAAIGRPDVLIHLAWGGLPNYRSRHHFEDELPSHYAFLACAVAGGLRNLVVTGTCFEYGMRDGALSEDLDPLPANPYGLAKDMLRRQLEFLRRDVPFDLTWARLFYMFGEGQAPTSLYPQLAAAVARGDATFAMSGGEQLRDYLPIDIVARHLVTLALAKCHHGVVNVCSGTPVSVRRLVEGWIAQHGWSITPDFGRYPYPDYEPLAFWGDATKLRDLIAPHEHA